MYVMYIHSRLTPALPFLDATLLISDVFLAQDNMQLFENTFEYSLNLRLR